MAYYVEFYIHPGQSYGAIKLGPFENESQAQEAIDQEHLKARTQVAQSGSQYANAWLNREYKIVHKTYNYVLEGESAEGVWTKMDEVVLESPWLYSATDRNCARLAENLFPKITVDMFTVGMRYQIRTNGKLEFWWTQPVERIAPKAERVTYVYECPTCGHEGTKSWTIGAANANQIVECKCRCGAEFEVGSEL